MSDPFKTIGDYIRFYRMQLKKFERVGMGNKTEFNVMVTPELVEVTKKRMFELVNKKVKRSRSNGQQTSEN